jgi:hypothetical protein
MLNEDQLKEIQDCIDAKQEGAYWEYKSKYITNGKLLKEIICLANNLDNRDAYILFGVDDDGKLNDITLDSNRKKQADVLQVLKSAKFAGGYRPEIRLEEVKIYGTNIDVLIIQKSTRTPFYLTDKYKTDNIGTGIYTRIGNVNTDVDKTADIDKQEYLWSKRFGLNLPIMERLHIVLDDWENWGNYDKNGNFVQSGRIGEADDNTIFHKYQPEFHIEFEKEDRWMGNSPDVEHALYLGNEVYPFKAEFLFNSTKLCTARVLAVDDGRKLIILSHIMTLENVDATSSCLGQFRFRYILKSDIRGKLHKIITHGTMSTKSRQPSEDKWLLVFDDDQQLCDFKKFVQENQYLYDANIAVRYVEPNRQYALRFLPDIENSWSYYQQWKTAKKSKGSSV